MPSKASTPNRSPATIYRARAYTATDPAIQHGAPGSPIPFVLSTPGIKRDGIDLAGIPFSVERYRSNPVVLAFHDYDIFPIGRGDISVVQTRGGEALVATVEFDTNDPLGALADSKVRNGFLHAVSIGWSDVDANGLPCSVTGKRVAAHEILEFSLVSVPADPDALVSIGGRSYSPSYVDIQGDGAGQRQFLGEALAVIGELDEEGDRLQEIEAALSRMGLCDGDECRLIAGALIGGARGGEAAETDEREPDTDQVDHAGAAQADDPLAGEARADAAKAAMLAALWVDPGQDVDDGARKKARDAVIPLYRRLGLVVPVMLPASVCASLPMERQAALFVNGEAAAMANATVGVTVTPAGARKGAKISGERLTRLADARAKISDGLADLETVISDAGSGDRSGPCGCKAGAPNPEGGDAVQDGDILSRLHRIFPGRVEVVEAADGTRKVMLDIMALGEEDSESEGAYGGSVTLDPALIEQIAASVAQQLAADVSLGYSSWPAMAEMEEEPGSMMINLSISAPPGVVDAEKVKAAVLASLAGTPTELVAPEAAPAPEEAPPAEPAPETPPAEVAPTGTAGAEAEETGDPLTPEELLDRMKSILGA